MRLETFLRRLAKRRRLRFGTVYARIIESQPQPTAKCAGNDLRVSKRQIGN
jgi:hypothetical protein